MLGAGKTVPEDFKLRFAKEQPKLTDQEAAQAAMIRWGAALGCLPELIEASEVKTQ